MRNYLSLDYKVSQSELPTVGPILDHLEQAEAAAEHLHGLFTLCQFLREDASFAERDALHNRYDKLTNALNHVGELGAAIADHIVGCVCEAQDKVLDLMPPITDDKNNPGQIVGFRKVKASKNK